MGHLYLSACMLCANKTAATYAAEIWIQRHTTLDNRLLGFMLGRHQRIEFAPMKRFTDLVVSKMMGVSASCNAALETMLAAMINELPPEGVRGQKKLISVYEEVKRNTATKSGDANN